MTGPGGEKAVENGRTGTGRRELTAAVLGVAGAAAAVLFAASRVWAVTELYRPVPLPPGAWEHTGGSVEPLLPAMALVALAGAGALLATRGLVRRIVGVLLMVCGGAVVQAAVAGWAKSNDGREAWPALGAVGGAVIVAAGLLAVFRSGGWPSMGTRYDRKPAPTADPAGNGSNNRSSGLLWDAIDRGDDPTR